MTDLPPVKIISGGQAGVDMLALRVAKAQGLPTGGFVPAGCVTIEGQRRELLNEFHMVECEAAPSIAAAYVQRSKRNVDAADVTIGLRWKDSVGTTKTLIYAETRRWADTRPGFSVPYKPTLDVDLRHVATDAAAIELIVAFVKKHRPRTINVCGPRKTQSETAQQTRARKILAAALAALYPSRAS